MNPILRRVAVIAVALVISSLRSDVLGLSLITAAIFAPFSGIIGRDPGFPTVLVTADVGTDFVCSGHRGPVAVGFS